MTGRSNSAHVRCVEKALDAYLTKLKARGQQGYRQNPGGIRAATLAKLAGVTRSQMSTMLMSYRWIQRRDGATRYVVGAQGYGQAARWRILAKPGSDPKAIREARLEQAMWIAQDGMARIVRDTLHEAFPALAGTAVDDIIEDEMSAMIDHLRVTVKTVDRRLARERVRV